MLLEEEYLVVDTNRCSYRNDDPEARKADKKNNFKLMYSPGYWEVKIER